VAFGRPAGESATSVICVRPPALVPRGLLVLNDAFGPGATRNVLQGACFRSSVNQFKNRQPHRRRGDDLQESSSSARQPGMCWASCAPRCAALRRRRDRSHVPSRTEFPRGAHRGAQDAVLYADVTATRLHDTESTADGIPESSVAGTLRCTMPNTRSTCIFIDGHASDLQLPARSAQRSPRPARACGDTASARRQAGHARDRRIDIASRCVVNIAIA